MKKILLLSLLFLSIVSCEAAKPLSGSSAALKKTSDSLATELAEVKTVLNYVLERGMNSSFEQVKAEIEKANKVHDLQIEGSPYIGNPNAKIVIVEFSDFQCPYSSRIAPFIDSLSRAHPDKLRIVFKNFPLSFHKEAPAASASAMAAEKQGKFWEYRWLLQANYQKLSDSLYVSLAEKLGLNVEQFKKDMVLDADKQAIIDRDIKLGMEVGVQGTPNFYINGKRQDRFSPALVDQIIKDLY